MPRIVAESLVALRTAPPLDLWPVAAAPSAIAAAMARALVPPLAGPTGAAWLRDRQGDTARRLVTVLQRHGGAMLADPVGSGKTFIALAVATALAHHGPAAALVPAPLVDQWRRRAEACGVALEVVSHAAVSRGRLPGNATRMVIIDESHHFRHPHTQRYATLAPWIAGRPTLCVTATPVVNRPEDLAYQLQLGVRDDALIAHGTPSLRDALRRGEVPPGLGELVIATATPRSIPGRRETKCHWSASLSGPPSWSNELDALTLADDGPVASLIRSVLWSAAGSSPAALRAALGRYALLLRQSKDAHRSGLAPDRSAIRRFAAEVPEQLLLWELLPLGSGTDVLPSGDLPRVEALRERIILDAPDPKAEALAELLADGTPSLVFTTSAATVPYLRDRLAGLAPAWVTGGRAGWKQIRLPRTNVLDWFRPDAADVAPRILIASDVAAEGLDLQRARRVVHYDLPWTAMRLAQREGRSRRLGALHQECHVVRMEPAPWIEQRLRVRAILRRKEGLLARAGLSGDGSGWRWRHDAAAECSEEHGSFGVAVISGERSSALAAFEIREEGSSDHSINVVSIDDEGRWTEAGEIIGPFLARARKAEGIEFSPECRSAWEVRCAAVAAALAHRRAVRGWAAPASSSLARDVVERAHRLLRRAAAERDRTALRALEGRIAFAARGHTAGEEAELASMATASDEEMKRERPGTAETRPGSGLWHVRLLALIVEVPRCLR